MPQRLAVRYLKFRQRADWDIQPISSMGVSKLAQKRFIKVDATAEVLKHPDRYSLDMLQIIHHITKRLPKLLLRICAAISPTLLITLKKPSADYTEE